MTDAFENTDESYGVQKNAHTYIHSIFFIQFQEFKNHYAPQSPVTQIISITVWLFYKPTRVHVHTINDYYTDQKHNTQNNKI